MPPASTIEGSFQSWASEPAHAWATRQPTGRPRNSTTSTLPPGRRETSSRRSLGEGGFSLIEVVIAVGIFAGAVVVILALFGPLNRSIGEVADTSRAARLAEAINAELLRLRDVQAPATGSKLDAVYTRWLNAGAVLKLVASTDGSHVVAEADAGSDPVNPGFGNPPGIALRDRYYLIEVRAQPAPLNYTPGTSAFLAVTATIKWPYQVATGPGPNDATAADLTQAQTLLLNYALPP